MKKRRHASQHKCSHCGYTWDQLNYGDTGGKGDEQKEAKTPPFAGECFLWLPFTLIMKE